MTEEARVLAYLRHHNGYYTIFWATDNQRRACALSRLVNSGQIIDDTRERSLGYPYCHAEVK